MKKRLVALLVCGAFMCSAVAGCGKKDDSTEAAQMTSGQYELNADELVTLCDYSAIDIELSQDYSVTDEIVTEQYNEMVKNTISRVEVTDRTTIQEGDVVLVDYTGYMDGEAFEGGAAKNQYITCADGTGYIDGFTDGLIGAEVGSTVSSDVTFPDPYPNNPDYSGKPATFEFVIHGIYKEGALDPETLTDEDVVNNFSSYGVSNVEELKAYVNDYLNQTSDYYKYQEIVTKVKEYLIENCTIDVPDEYLNIRVEEYIAQFTSNYVTEGQTLESYLQAQYQVSEAEARDQWKELMTKTIKTELIFEAIANKEGVEIDEDKFTEYVNGMASNYNYADATATYQNFGNGNAEEGEAYLRRLYRINTAIDIVVEKVQTHVAEPSADEGSTEEATEAAE